MNQAYSRLSTTHGHITDCKLDLVVYAGVCMAITVDLSCLGRTIYARQIFGCQATDSIPPQVSRKESLRPFMLTPSCPVGCLTHCDNVSNDFFSECDKECVCVWGGVRGRGGRFQNKFYKTTALMQSPKFVDTAFWEQCL